LYVADYALSNQPHGIDPFLDRYLLEHGLAPDGRPDPEKKIDANEEGSFETFFTESGSQKKYIPRSIFVDLDPSVCYTMLAIVGD
jgi:hypothetical protein